MFVLKHQDGDSPFTVKAAGYCVEDSFLFMSIQCVADDKDAFPDLYYFAVEKVPICAPLVPHVIQIQTNEKDEPPNVHVYTTFHASRVEASVNIASISEGGVTILLVVQSNDVNYHGPRAKPSQFTGQCFLQPCEKHQLWLP